MSVVLDNESYFTVDGSIGFGNDFYFEYEDLEVPENVKIKPATEFLKKFWFG